MSNEFVQASANFLTESWYKENAGTPQYQDAKYLEQAFDLSRKEARKVLSEWMNQYATAN